MKSAAENRYWLLNAISGWRASAPFSGIVQAADGSLSLQSVPGAAEPFGGDLTGKVLCPAALAGGDCGIAYVLDSAADRVVEIAAANQARVRWQFGGRGSQPRQFDAPRGLAAVRGAIAVCDTGNHRVQVFSPSPHALIQLWGRADGQPGEGKLEFNRPWGIAADAAGNLYVADRGNRRVQKIAIDGTWLAALGTGALTDPTEIAVSAQGPVAVVDGGHVQLFPPGAAAPLALPNVDQPRAVAFDAAGNLFVGTATGLVYLFVPDGAIPEGYRQVDAGVTGLAAAAVNLAWVPDRGLLGVFQNAESPGRGLWTIPLERAFVYTGTYVTAALDSGIEDCPWDRVTLLGTIPDGSNLRVEYFTSGDPSMAMQANPGDGPAWTCRGDSKPLTGLIQANPGRFLRLKFTFQSDGLSTPRIEGIQVAFPRASYLRYLPAVYQEDPESRAFLDRFLSIFQATFDDFDARIDAMWRLFDPEAVPPEYFDWLAAWLQLPTDPEWTIAKKRRMLGKAVGDYRNRGTVAGLIEAIEDYAGASDGVAIVEHFRLRNWAVLAGAPLGGEARLGGRSVSQRLQVGTFSQVGGFKLADRPEPAAEASAWGANEFSVFFPADPYDPEPIAARVAAVVERDKPAHTQANYVPVLPRFRVGVQATLGIDTSVGGYTVLVLGSHSRLGYDAILGCTPAQRDLEALGAAAHPRTGITTRLF